MSGSFRYVGGDDGYVDLDAIDEAARRVVVLRHPRPARKRKRKHKHDSGGVWGLYTAGPRTVKVPRTVTSSHPRVKRNGGGGALAAERPGHRGHAVGIDEVSLQVPRRRGSSSGHLRERPQARDFAVSGGGAHSGAAAASIVRAVASPRVEARAPAGWVSRPYHPASVAALRPEKSIEDSDSGVDDSYDSEYSEYGGGNVSKYTGLFRPRRPFENVADYFRLRDEHLQAWCIRTGSLRLSNAESGRGVVAGTAGADGGATVGGAAASGASRDDSSEDGGAAHQGGFDEWSGEDGGADEAPKRSNAQVCGNCSLAYFLIDVGAGCRR